MGDNYANVPADVKRAITNQELAEWEAQSYRLALRHRVQVKLGNDRAIEDIVKAMETAEEAIALMREELADLVAVAPDS